MSGPLNGVRVIELAAIGPVPFAGMMLADLGADVVRIDRGGSGRPASAGDPLSRGRRSIAVDLKHPDAAGVVLQLVAGADVLIEGFRPGVMERLGLGPEVCTERNPALVYGRMTGWGQEGPLAPQAGHDINYVAIAGVLHHIGRADSLPVPPINLVGDFGGGGMLLVCGVLAALHEARSSGRGQVVDAAMVDGAALLMASIFNSRAEGRWRDERGTNLIDSGAPFYDVYETADGRLISIGALEKQFFAELLAACEIPDDEWPDRMDRSTWPAMRERFAEIFRTRTLAEWTERFASRDACFAPVLTMGDAPQHPHNAARETFTTIEGVVQPSPAPRFSRTPTDSPRRGPVTFGEHSDDVLAAAGFDAGERERLYESGAVTRP